MANIFIDYENKEEKLRDEILKVKTHLPENPLEALEIYPITFGVKKHYGEVNMISLVNTFFDKIDKMREISKILVLKFDKNL